MKFKTFILDNSKNCKESEFLSRETEHFLRNSHNDIHSFLNNAKNNGEHFVSLAMPINKCIMNELKKQSIIENN